MINNQITIIVYAYNDNDWSMVMQQRSIIVYSNNDSR